MLSLYSSFSRLITLSILLTSISILTGCAITRTAGQEFDSSKVSSIKPGRTTKSEVLSYLGNPRTKNIIPGGKEIWQYSYGTSSSPDTAEAFIPVYGVFSDKRITSSSEAVNIEFRGDVVSDCTYTKLISDGNIKYGMGINTENQTTETTKCGATSSYTPASSTVSREQVYEAQILLNKHGFNAGTPDGIMGSKTRNAIQSFQQANGMPVDGKVSDALLSRLRVNVN